MKLIWHGHSCFSVATEAGTAVFDPYKDHYVRGLGALRLTADAVFCSHEHSDHNARDAVNLTGGPFSAQVLTVPSFHDDKLGLLRGKNTIHILSAEGLRVAHLGDLGHMLRGKALEAVKGVDALLIPVGGHYTIDPVTASELADAIGARVVIPMHYRLGSMGYQVLAELSAFTSLRNDVIEYDTDTFELTADTPAQTAVLRCVHE